MTETPAATDTAAAPGTTPDAEEKPKQYQSLDDEYRRLLAEYEAEVALYQTLLARDPNNPELGKHYEGVEAKNRKVRDLYTQIEEMRRNFGASSRAS